MGLFDIFKKKPPTHEEKVDLAYRCYKPEKVGLVFPGGKKQASNIIRSIAKLIGANLESLDAKGYYGLLSIFSDVLIRRVVTHSTDDNIVASLQSKHSQEIKNKAIAQKVLAYCTINMQNHDFCLDNAESIDALSLFDNILSKNEQIAQSNGTAQTENLDDPDYGLVPEKPVYVKGVEGSEEYLRNLRTSLGEIVTWERRGSLAVDNVNGMVDIYEIILPSGKLYKTIYLNMYGMQNSTKAPKGFDTKWASPDTTFKKGHRSNASIVSSLHQNFAKLLIMNYVSYKNNGQGLTLQVISKGLDSFSKMKEYEECICALANTYTLDKQRTYLDLVEELICPPSQLTEGLHIFAFANKLRRGIASSQDAQHFEDYVKATIGSSDPKNLDQLREEYEPVQYVCPQGTATEKELKEYDSKLGNAMVFASHQAGISHWHRKYQGLWNVAFVCARKSFDNGQGVIRASKLPSFNGNTTQAFHLLCTQALYAGIIAAKAFCQADGNADGIEQRIIRMNFREISDEAAHIMGYPAGNDNTFTNKYVPITSAVIDFWRKTSGNSDLSLKTMVLTLKAVFEFGAGLYFK